MSVRGLSLTQLPGAGAAVGATGAVLAASVALAATRNPFTALIVMVGLCAVVASAFRPEFALLLLVVTGPLEGEFQSSTTSTLSLTKIAGLLAFGSFAVNAVAIRRRIFADANHLVVVLLLCIAMLSMTRAPDTAIASSTTIRYASFVMLFWVVSQSVGDHRLQRRIAWTLVLSAGVAAALALDNFVSGHTAVATLKGTQEDDMGFMLATSLPFAFWLLGSRPVLRPFVLVLIGLLGTALVFSFARSGMLGLAAGAVWQVFVERRHVRLLLLGALAASLAALFIVHSNSSQVSSGLRLKQDVAAQNVSTRLEAWSAAAGLAADHPLLGVGPGNFRDFYYQATGRPPGSLPRLSVVHNAYLDIAAELGIVAMMLFLTYLALVFTRLAECVRAGVGPPGFASILRTSLVVACVGALTLSEQYFIQFWLFGGLASALWAERRQLAAALPAAAFEPEGQFEGLPEARPYDSGVSERRLEERERRTGAQFEAIRAQREQLRRRVEALRAQEEHLEHRARDVAQSERSQAEAAASLAERERALTEQEEALAGLREQAEIRSATLASESQRLVDRRRRVAARETELNDLALRLAALEEELEGKQRDLRRDAAELVLTRREVEAVRAEVSERERELRNREAEAAVLAAELEARLRRLDADELGRT